MDQLEAKEVQHIAYRLWQQRGSPIGSSEEDWLRAEEEYRRCGARGELPIFSLAMGPMEE
jgi:hypothetical protein